MPAPSPMTKPSRPSWKGRQAVSLSLFVDNARLALNPAIAMSVIGASVPPVIIASASPRWIILNASPIEFVPVAHAVTVEPLGPFAPVSIETCPVAISGISIGTKNGLTSRTFF